MPSGTITSLDPPHPGSRARVIRIAGDPWRTTSAAVVRRLRLAEGQTVDLGDIERRIAEIEPEEARARAVRALSRAELPAAALVERLDADGYPPELARAVVGSLEELGWVDDERFARMYARALAGGRGYGRARVRRTLAHKGVSDESMAGVLDECCPPEGEADRAAEVARRLAPACGGSVQKLAARLLRRGFDGSAAFTAARSALADGAADLPDLDA